MPEIVSQQCYLWRFDFFEATEEFRMNDPDQVHSEKSPVWRVKSFVSVIKDRLGDMTIALQIPSENEACD